MKAKYSRYEKAYVFGTGPSLQEAYNFDFSDGICIISNSIVKNKKLLEHIKPDILVASDPLFHFGCSQYANSFRKEMFSVIKKYDLDFFYSFFYAPLMECHFPSFSAKSFPVPSKVMDNFNLNLSKEFIIKGVDNILTLLLLPIATTLADEIFILGCDGRKPDEKYFWKHDVQSQYTDLMDGVKKCHPGFFNHVVYEDYYDQHCKNLEKLLLQGEILGKHFYSITNSYIPALAKRAEDPDNQ